MYATILVHCSLFVTYVYAPNSTEKYVVRTKFLFLLLKYAFLSLNDQNLYFYRRNTYIAYSAELKMYPETERYVVAHEYNEKSYKHLHTAYS